MRVIVNKTKTILAAVMLLFFGGYGIYFAVTKAWLPAAVFIAIAVVFSFVLVRCGSTVHIDAERITLAFLGLTRRTLPWSEVREVGLIGENVFNQRGGRASHKTASEEAMESSAPGQGFTDQVPKRVKTGDKYVYFSPVSMNADERFTMIVKWPPRRQIYAIYSEKLLAYVMAVWGRELETYNVEDLYANSAEPRGSQQ